MPVEISDGAPSKYKRKFLALSVAQGDYVMLSNFYLLGVKQTQKTRYWSLLGVLFKISDEYPRPFYMGSSSSNFYAFIYLFKPLPLAPSPFFYFSRAVFHAAPLLLN